MLSVVVLERDTQPDKARAELIVRSLAWLVSAVVAGVVRDVTLAASPAMALAEIADVTGCAFVEAESEMSRLREATDIARSDRILVLSAGYSGDMRLAEALESFERFAAPHEDACVLRARQSRLDALRPTGRRTVGILTSRERCRPATSFVELKRICRSGTRLTAHLHPVG